MCTKEEVRTIIHEEIFNPLEDGSSRLDKHIDEKLNRLFWRIVRWLGGAVVVTVIGTTVAWTNLQNEVEQNTEFRNAGDRFTLQDGKILQQQIDDSRKQQERMEAWLIRIEGKLDQAIK